MSRQMAIDEKKIKILMIAPTPYFSDRGCHVRIFEEARALTTRGHEVCICTYHLGRDIGGISTCRIQQIPWYKKRSAGPSWHKLYLDLMLFLKSRSVAKRFAPDIIHAHLHEGAFLGYFLKKYLGVPMVFDCQGSLTGELVDHAFIRKDTWLYRLFRSVEQLIDRGADHIVTSSTPAADMLLAEFNMPTLRVTTVCDGVDVDAFAPAPPSVLLRQQLALPADVPIIVYLGAMTEYQGLDLLLEAIKILKSQGTRLHFLLMGYPEERYRSRAVDMGISSMVTFTGKIEYSRAAEYLCLGTLAVSPKLSKTEANGKLYNYIACGLPSVVFDTPVNREILGGLGVYANFGDAEDLAQKIATLANDKKCLADLANKVRQKAICDYSWHEVSIKIESVYRNILQ